MRWTFIFTCVLLAAACQREVALVDLPALTGKVEEVVLAGESKRSITAPLSAELSIPLELPRNAELVFSAALLSERRVPRARVDFRVELSVDGSAIEVYRREVPAGEENRWHDGRVDLGAWSGKSVAMTLAAEPSSGPSPAAWVSRVRPAWGNPSIRARRAYVVFTSDHGEELSEHEGWNHGNNLYDHQLHVPLLIRKPLAEDAGRRIASLVSLVDLMPTLSSLGGVEAPSGILGRDFSALLRGESEGRATAVFADGVNQNPRTQGVRTLSHKLIWDEERGTLELYDLVADPKERRNLREADPQTMARMKTHLQEHLARNQARGALASETIPLDDELWEGLKALGYVQ